MSFGFPWAWRWFWRWLACFSLGKLWGGAALGGVGFFLDFLVFWGWGWGFFFVCIVFLSFSRFFYVFLGFSLFSWVFLWGWGGAWAKGNVQGRLNKGISSFSLVFLWFCWVFLAWGASSGPSSWALGQGLAWCFGARAGALPPFFFSSFWPWC